MGLAMYVYSLAYPSYSYIYMERKRDRKDELTDYVQGNKFGIGRVLF